jgi:hypothetical protein
MATTRTRNTSKTPAPRKTAAKKTLPETTPTTVDLRRPLPVRRKVFVGPMGITEQAAIRAALASAAARLPIPVTAWHGPTAHLADGTTLTHTPAHATTDQQSAFHATIRCPHGAIHAHTIHTADDLTQARQLTAQCQQRTTSPAPNPAVRALGDALARARAAATDTQPIPVVHADCDQAKEHPQP